MTTEERMREIITEEIYNYEHLHGKRNRAVNNIVNHPEIKNLFEKPPCECTGIALMDNGICEHCGKKWDTWSPNKTIEPLAPVDDDCKGCSDSLNDEQESCDHCGKPICASCGLTDNEDHTGTFCKECCKPTEPPATVFEYEVIQCAPIFALKTTVCPHDKGGAS